MVAVSLDRKSTRLNSSHGSISYAVFCLKKKKKNIIPRRTSTSDNPLHSYLLSHAEQSVPQTVVQTCGLMACYCLALFFFFFFNDTATTEIYTLSLHDALPI